RRTRTTRQTPTMTMTTMMMMTMMMKMRSTSGRWPVSLPTTEMPRTTSMTPMKSSVWAT
ncbi:hypothetical protein CRUP_001794, partial [Coryphaenoides rupestris]